MGRHKFENQFKNKLEKRELKPSSGGWEQLAKKLNSEDKKARPVFWWMGIAATVAGGILIFSLTFNNQPVSEKEKLVETPSEKIIEEKQEEQPVEKQEIASEEVETKIISEENTETPKKPETSDKPINNIPAPAIAENEQIDANDTETENSAISEVIKEELYSDKLEEVIAAIESKENNEGEVTDAEVDALLAEAASELARNKEKKFTSDNIDATALLWDVEMEMEQSFREKVFEVLKEGYLKAKTAVAARNN